MKYKVLLSLRPQNPVLVCESHITPTGYADAVVVGEYHTKAGAHSRRKEVENFRLTESNIWCDVEL